LRFNTHVPKKLKVTTPEVTEQMEEADASTVNTGVKPDDADTWGVYVPPTCAFEGAGVTNETVWTPLAMENVCETCAAAENVTAFPAWSAATLQLPWDKYDTTPFEIEHAPTGVATTENTIGSSPRFETAAGVYEPEPTAAPTGALVVKLNVWSPRLTGSVKEACPAAK